MIENQQVYITYTADGVQREWEFPYQYVKPEDISLYIEHDGVLTQIASQLYAFSEVTKKVTYPLDEEEAPVPAGDSVLLWRETNITQEEDSSIANFKSNDLERMTDKLTMICQELSDKYNRAVHFEPTDVYDTDATTYVKTITDAKDTAVQAASDAHDDAVAAAGSASDASGSAVLANNYKNAASASATEAKKWAEGTDQEVTPLGGEHSSKGWSDVAKHYAETIGAALVYKGSVATYSDLPSSGQKIGDFYNVLDTGKNYAWTGTEWDDVSGIMDLSAYRTAAAQDVIDSGKQDTLVSGTNIKTINGNSLLGSGNVNINALPSQTGQSGKFLTTDGTDASWANVDALPSQTGQSGKFLTTDGSAASWAEIPTEVDNKSVTLNSNDEIQTVGVIDQNDTTKAIKKWTGTKAKYDAIVTKDPDTEYTTTDENETVYQNSYRIGQVLPSILPISDYGLHLLDGAVIDGTGIYSSFYSYIAGLVSTYPDLFISEADWQTAVTTYGVCGKFVYNSTNQTIRLPKITGIIEGTTDVTALGDLVQAGLPNITGGMSPTGLAGVSNSYGAFYDEVSNVTDYQSNTREGYGVRWGFNASRSSSIYGNSNTVQPQTIKVYYYIVIANSYQTPTGVQISKVATDLNGKVNLNSSWGFPTGEYIDLTLGASGTAYTAPADGYVAVSKLSTANLQNITIDLNGWRAFVWANAADINIFTWLPVKKGATYWVYYNLGGATNYFRFYYTQKDNN